MNMKVEYKPVTAASRTVNKRPANTTFNIVSLAIYYYLPQPVSEQCHDNTRFARLLTTQSS